MEENGRRIGVLSFHESKESKAILNAIEALGHTPVWLRENNLILRFTDGQFEVEPAVDVVINRLLLSKAKQPVEAVGLAHAIAQFRPMLNPPYAAACASHKVAAAAALLAADVPIPETAIALGTRTLGRIRPDFGEEHVYKTIVGTHGGGAWRVHQNDLITGRVGRRGALLQELVDTDGNRPRDLRIYVVDGEVIGAMYRYAAEGDWRTNVSRGGTVEDATETLPNGTASMAVQAATAVGLDMAGVDLIEGTDGWSVLEVNPTAGFKGLYRATGRCPAADIARVAIERVGGTVDHDRIDEWRHRFDDSIPSSMPAPAAPVDREVPVIGLTERVIVSGTTDTKVVIGRADTAIQRTRIDLQLAAAIGAGPIQVEDASKRGRRQRRPVVDVVIGIAGTEQTVAATVHDAPDATHPLHLGRDVLKGFQVDVGTRYTEPQPDPPVD